MSSMPSPGPMANSVYVVAPHNGYPVVSGTMPQVPLYPNNQPQIHVIPGNLPVSVPTQKVLKNGKVLGAIQILIGLVHIGLGSIMLANLSKYYVPISLYGGFPFWGAIWIPLSVCDIPNALVALQMNGSVGLNIFSAICSAAGIILFITEMSVSGIYGYPNDYHYYTNWNTGMAISGVLLIFCILELCIASVSSHFGCQVTCCQNNNVNVAIPNVYATNTVVFPEPSNPMPSYSNVVQNSR